MDLGGDTSVVELIAEIAVGLIGFAGVVFLRETLPASYVMMLFVSILLSLYHFIWLVLSIQAAEE